MVRTLLFVTPLLLGLSNTASGDWTYDMTSELCSTESRNFVASNVRKQIESSVQRAEASINPPVPIEELGCLEGLMNLPIANFASTGSLGGLFDGTLDRIINSNGSVAAPFCSYAEREWRKATRPLSGMAFRLPSYLNLSETLRAGMPARANPTRPEVGRPNSAEPSSQREPATENVQKSGTDNLIDEYHGQLPESAESIEDIWTLMYGEGDTR